MPEEYDREYGGPDGYDLDRPSSEPSPGRWLIRGGKILAAVAALLALLAMFGRPLLSIIDSPYEQEQPLAIERKRATVLEVVDGATIAVETGGERRVVRYLGINPPVFGTDFYNLATEVNSEWVMGEVVLLEEDPAWSGPGEELFRYVWIEENMVNAALLAYGLARLSPSGSGLRYADAFARIEQDARDAGEGMWGYRGTGEKGAALYRSHTSDPDLANAR
jgi:micrococcal nuclease